MVSKVMSIPSKHSERVIFFPTGRPAESQGLWLVSHTLHLLIANRPPRRRYQVRRPGSRSGFISAVIKPRDVEHLKNGKDVVF